MKKIILLLSAALVVVACSKAGKGEYIISGTAKGIENGKTVILETQDETGMLVAKDTVKVENGKFEMKGKITETGEDEIKTGKGSAFGIGGVGVSSINLTLHF